MAAQEEWIPATMLASATAGLLGRIPFHPLDTLKSRVQVHGRGMTATASHLVRSHGVRALFRGLAVVALGSIPAACLYFTSYELSKGVLGDSTPAHLVSGVLAEAVACTLFVPIDVVKERLQVAPTSTTMASVSRSIGLSGLYRAYWATVGSFGPFSGLNFAVYEYLRAHHLGYGVSAVLSSATASVLTNPLDLVKLRMQVGGFGYTSLGQGLVRVVRDEGPAALFRGSLPRVLFQAPSVALTFTLMEYFRAGLL